MARKISTALSFVLILLVSAAHGIIAQEVFEESDNKPIPVESSECVGKQDGIYPNPSNCSNFLACSGNATFIINCNEGLLFDAESSRCEWASKANCAPPPEVTEAVTEVMESTTAEPETTPARLPAAEEENLPVEVVENTTESVTDSPVMPTETTPENSENVTDFTTAAPQPVTDSADTESTTNPPAPGPPENRLVFKNFSDLNPLTDNPVQAGFNDMNEPLYICRAQYSPGVVIPGQTSLTKPFCYIPADLDGEDSESSADFEILTNPTNQRIVWLQSSGPGAKKLPPNTVVGGKFLSSKIYLFYVGRCIVQVSENTNPIVVPGSVNFNAFHFLYEAKVATDRTTYRCKNNYQILLYV